MINKKEIVVKEIKEILAYEKAMQVLLKADDITCKKYGKKHGEPLTHFFLTQNVKAFTPAGQNSNVRENVEKLLQEYGSFAKLDASLKSGFDLCREKINKYEFKEMYPKDVQTYPYYELLNCLRLYSNFSSFYQEYTKKKNFPEVIRNTHFALKNGSSSQAWEICLKMKKEYIDRCKKPLVKVRSMK